MTRIALKLSNDLIAAACQFAGEDNIDIFGDSTYALVEVVSPTEFNFKLMPEDEIFEAVKTDATLPIICM